MAWSGGTYRKGNYSTNGWTGDASLGIGIEAGRHDTQDDDFMNGINQCLNKDGSNAATGNLNLGSNKLTNVANGTVVGDAINLGQAQAGIDTQGTALSTSQTRFSADAVGPSITLRKSRGATLGVNTIVQNGDQTGALIFAGANGTGYDPTSAIIGSVDGVPGATGDMPGALRFYATSDGSASLTERMRITASDIDISTRILFSAISTPPITGMYAPASNTLGFSTGTAERMRISSNGDLGVGVSPTGGYRLHIQGQDAGGTNQSLVVQNSAAATTLAVRNDGLINTGNAANSPFNLTTATAANMVVASGGNLQRSTSSLKYKTDVNDSVHGLAEVLQLRPVTYKGKNDGETVFGGLIAEEVAAIGLTEFVQYADDETPDALAYGNMVSLAFKAIQELNAKVEALKAQVAELEA